MPHDADVTTGELYRLLQLHRNETQAATLDQNRKLDAIEEQVRKTNGQVISHDGRLKNLERETFHRHRLVSSPPAETAKGSIAFSFTPDTKTVLAVLGAAAVVIGLLIKEWMGR